MRVMLTKKEYIVIQKCIIIAMFSAVLGIFLFLIYLIGL